MEHPIPGRFRLCASAVVVKPLALVDRLFRSRISSTIRARITTPTTTSTIFKVSLIFITQTHCNGSVAFFQDPNQIHRQGTAGNAESRRRQCNCGIFWVVHVKLNKMKILCEKEAKKTGRRQRWEFRRNRLLCGACHGRYCSLGRRAFDFSVSSIHL